MSDEQNMFRALRLVQHNMYSTTIQHTVPCLEQAKPPDPPPITIRSYS